MLVAKRKGGKREGSGAKPVGGPGQERKSTIMVRGTHSWRAFVDRFAEFDRAASAAELVDRALEHYAKAKGYPGPIPRR